jgi:hypothetical protein
VIAVTEVPENNSEPDVIIPTTTTKTSEAQNFRVTDEIGDLYIQPTEE